MLWITPTSCSTHHDVSRRATRSPMRSNQVYIHTAEGICAAGSSRTASLDARDNSLQGWHRPPWLIPPGLNSNNRSTSLPTAAGQRKVQTPQTTSQNSINSTRISLRIPKDRRPWTITRFSVRQRLCQRTLRLHSGTVPLAPSTIAHFIPTES